VNFSVTSEATPVLPPKLNAEFCEPQPANNLLTVFKLRLEIQICELNFSVTAESAPVVPPKLSAAF